MSSTPSYFSVEKYSLNHKTSGINNQIGPFKGQTPFVPQPMGSPPGLPSSPGQLQVESPIQNSKYLITSNSLPVMGERENNHILQGGNLSLNSHNSSYWCSGLRKDRNPAPSPEFAPRVCQFSTSNEFQQLFYEARNIAEHTYFLIRYFFDVSQIKNLEDFHRIIDIQIGRITPFISQQTEEYNVYEMVKALRVIQTRIEDTLISFYQNLEERDRMKVIFTLPQLRDHSYISAVNRSVHFKVSQSINNSVNKSIFQSNNKSISPNSSLGKNSSNDFSPVRMSSPNKEEAKVPDFNPPLEKEILKDRGPILTNLLGVNHKTRADAKSDSSISSPQIAQKVVQNVRVNSRHCSGIDLETEVGKLLISSKNEQMQPSTLKLKANDLKSKLTSLNIDKWINDDKLGHFDPIDLSNWEDKIDRDIATVLYQTEDLINIRKGLAQSGIKKRDPPIFSGYVLDYPLFKKKLVY